MTLSAEEKRILDGEKGEAKQFAIRILSKLGDACGADCFIPVSSAHVVACSYQIAGQAGIELYEKLIKQGARVAVPTTLDPGSIDFKRWQNQRVPEDWAEGQNHLAKLLEAMGVIPVWTCTPYYVLNVPIFGQDLAWSESSAVAFVNSVIGARTNRMSAYVDLCAALLGKIPRFGLHLPEKRRGEILVELDRQLSEKISDIHFPILGYLVGQLASDNIPVISGIKRASFDQLKAFSAAVASTGSVAMYHIVGVTPEARTIEEAFNGNKPLRRIRIGLREAEQTMETMRTYEGGNIDVVGIGCPHASIDQLRHYARLLEGKKISANLKLWVCTNTVVEDMARRMGYIETIERAGAQIMTGTCLNNCPLSAWQFKNLVTDSGKFSYYAPTNLGVKCYYTSTRCCIETAIRGSLLEEEAI